MCRPVLSDVVRSQPAPSTSTIVNAPYATTVNVDNHTTNNIDNSTTIHNHTTNITINPIGREDLSHITDEQWHNMVKLTATEGCGQIVANLVALINYNPEKPENMNVYIPPVEDASQDALIFWRRGGDACPRWQCIDKKTAVMWLTNDKTSNIQEWVDDNKTRVSKADAQRIDDYYDLVNKPGESEEQRLANIVEAIASSGSRVIFLQPVDGSQRCAAAHTRGTSP